MEKEEAEGKIQQKQLKLFSLPNRIKSDAPYGAKSKEKENGRRRHEMRTIRQRAAGNE